MRRGPHWYAGSADAIFQSLDLVYDERPEYVIVFGADHVYRMDPRQMVEQHIAAGAGVTVAGIRVPIGDANQFGVIETAEDGRRISALGEAERPSWPAGRARPGVRVHGQLRVPRRHPDRGGVAGRRDEDSKHDLGGNIIPMMVERGKAESTTSPTTTCGSPTVTVATGRTSAPSTPTTTPTWT